MSRVIIKAGDVGRVTRSLASLDLRDIAGQAEAMLAAARVEAERIIDDARCQADAGRVAVRQAAHDEGLAEGLAEGRAAGHEAALTEAREQFAADQSALQSALSKLLADLGERREQLYASARRDVVVLAIVIASRIVRRFASLEAVAPEAATEAGEEALGLLQATSDVVVRTHPDDAAAIERLAGQLAEQTRESRHVRIVEDESVGRGGVHVAAADTAIDATIGTRIERIADELVTDWRDRAEALGIQS